MRIDTTSKYAILLCLIAFMNAIKVLVAELGEPVLVFNVYNPDKTVITDFTRPQLLAYANLMFFVSNTRRMLDVLVTVTQFHIALFSVWSNSSCPSAPCARSCARNTSTPPHVGDDAFCGHHTKTRIDG